LFLVCLAAARAHWRGNWLWRWGFNFWTKTTILERLFDAKGVGDSE